MEPNEPINGLSRETVWRREPTPEQAQRLGAWLATHPADGEVWEEEVALTRLLTRLPDTAPPSNLTARVLDAIDERPSAATHVFGLGWLRKLGWVPRLAGVALLVMVGYLAHHQYQVSRRGELARNVAEISELVAAVPSVQVLQDFTAIRNLEGIAVPDEELLALLQ